jgi:hypothetical protein
MSRFLVLHTPVPERDDLGIMGLLAAMLAVTGKWRHIVSASG